jgi:hypothetical protein
LTTCPPRSCDHSCPPKPPALCTAEDNSTHVTTCLREPCNFCSGSQGRGTHVGSTAQSPFSLAIERQFARQNKAYVNRNVCTNSDDMAQRCTRQHPEPSLLLVKQIAFCTKAFCKTVSSF